MEGFRELKLISINFRVTYVDEAMFPLVRPIFPRTLPDSRAESGPLSNFCSQELSLEDFLLGYIKTECWNLFTIESVPRFVKSLSLFDTSLFEATHIIRGYVLIYCRDIFIVSVMNNVKVYIVTLGLILQIVDNIVFIIQ